MVVTNREECTKQDVEKDSADGGLADPETGTTVRIRTANLRYGKAGEYKEGVNDSKKGQVREQSLQ